MFVWEIQGQSVAAVDGIKQREDRGGGGAVDQVSIAALPNQDVQRQPVRVHRPQVGLHSAVHLGMHLIHVPLLLRLRPPANPSRDSQAERL